ncbi:MULTISPECIES: acyl-CoA thioesterase [Ramlibacter]|uniref:Thioesterase family protein n=1 Tax=Ramlibacter pinisoli TaxID=2682844 RepID=A0A6N8IS35_9BURK|nr:MULTISPECIES: thioesterase family protein [Ramlibacter]MBA2964746.1 thioesterase family protein [Ramlibacter sp. CGMCC 1.13660]MVQ29711.1 thioesterase family protein [Ramlibacter pinisoli]
MEQETLTHPFDDAVALEPVGDDLWRGHTSAAYGNMVGPFGGVTAAQALSAVLRHPGLLGEPVALTVNFAAALADGPFEVQARPVRTNRSTQHWMLEIRQQGEAVLTGTAFTALRRATWDRIEHEMPAVPRAADVPRAGGPRRVEWVGRYEMRFIDGALPTTWDGQEQGDSRSRLWLRDAPPRAIDFASLTALADVFFPRVWRRRPVLVPIGTVSMTVYFHAGADQLRAAGTGYLLGQAQAQAFRGGYFDQTAQLWTEGGDLLATTHQVVYYKE